MQSTINRQELREHDHYGKGEGATCFTFFFVHKFLNDLLLQGVFDVDKEAGLTLIEIAEDVQIEDIIASTGCEFSVADDLKPMRQA